MARKKVTRKASVKKTSVAQNPVQNVTSKASEFLKSSGPSNLLILLLVGVSFFAGYLFFKLKSLEQANTTAAVQQAGAQQPARPEVTMDQIKGLFKDGFLHFGDANKKALFVMISDPSCPFCHMAGGKNPELAATSGQFKYVSDGGTYTPPVEEMRKLVDSGDASFVLLYSNGHGNGRLGAQAMYCAYEQGKFWEVHDLLMSNAGYTLMNDTVQNDKANSQVLADFLAPAIDSTFMNDCLQSGKYEETLSRDESVSQQMGFSGTPDFFVNTTNFAGAQDYKTMEAAVKAALGG